MNPKIPFYIKLTIILLGIVLLVIIMMNGKPVLVPLLISLLLAILISSFTSWLERYRFPKILAVFISVLIVLVALTGLMFFFINQIANLSQDLGSIESRIAELMKSFNNFLVEKFDLQVPVTGEKMRQTVFQQISKNMSVITQGIVATAGTLASALIVPIYIFLFLYYRQFLVAFVKKAFSRNSEERVSDVIYKIKDVVHNYIKGMFIVILILSVLYSIAFFSLGLKYAILFAVFAAFLNVIPFVGPLMTIIALFIGGFIWGVAGMILFIPGMAILKVIFDEVEGMQPFGFLLGEVDKEYN